MDLTDIVNVVTIESRRPTVPKELCSKLKEFLRVSWQADSSQRPTLQEMLQANAFDEFILDSTISHANLSARRFWKEKFMGKWEIPWPTFVEGFMNFMKIPSQMVPMDDIRLECLKSVLRPEESSGLVIIESFAMVLEWFGPLEISHGHGIHFLDSIYNLLKQKYFHGFISTSTAEKLLNKVIVENQKKLIKEDSAGIAFNFLFFLQSFFSFYKKEPIY